MPARLSHETVSLSVLKVEQGADPPSSHAKLVGIDQSMADSVSPVWEQSAVVGTRVFVLMMLPVLHLCSQVIPPHNGSGDLGEGLIVLFPIAVVLGVPVGFINAYLACWIGDAHRVSSVWLAAVLAVLCDFAVVGAYLSICLWWMS